MLIYKILKMYGATDVNVLFQMINYTIGQINEWKGKLILIDEAIIRELNKRTDDFYESRINELLDHQLVVQEELQKLTKKLEKLTKKLEAIRMFERRIEQLEKEVCNIYAETKNFMEIHVRREYLSDIIYDKYGIHTTKELLEGQEITVKYTDELQRELNYYVHESEIVEEFFNDCKHN